jgi:hypothetical protein
MKKEPVYFLASDGLPARRDADPKCKKCNGYGILDDGDSFGPALVPCECCSKEKP